MSNSQHLRIGVAFVLATTAYYYLLMISIGYLLAVSWPTWWMGIFPSTLIGSRVWLFAMHTAAVLISAIPVALLVRLLVPGHAVAVCLVAALSALVLVNLPLDRDAITLVWASPSPSDWRQPESGAGFASLGLDALRTPSNPPLERPLNQFVRHLMTRRSR